MGGQEGEDWEVSSALKGRGLRNAACVSAYVYVLEVCVLGCAKRAEVVG